MSQWKYYDVGVNNVGSYQVGGVPFVTGSTLSAGQEQEITFPYVTKTITIIQSSSADADLRIHFAATGSGRVIDGNHYIVLRADKENVELPSMKCRNVYLSAPSSNSVSVSYKLHASLTRIDSKHMWYLTGSGITD